MSASFTKSTARNIFYGGAVFFFLLFLALTVDTVQTLPKRDNRANLTEQVARGKKCSIWQAKPVCQPRRSHCLAVSRACMV